MDKEQDNEAKNGAGEAPVNGDAMPAVLPVLPLGAAVEIDAIVAVKPA